MLMSDPILYSTLATNILKSQISVIGPLAIDQAKKVTGLLIDASNSITIKGDGKEILAKLVHQFETLFGQASVEACKDAIKETQLSISPSDLPEILR